MYLKNNLTSDLRFYCVRSEKLKYLAQMSLNAREILDLFVKLVKQAPMLKHRFLIYTLFASKLIEHA
jgi:hypothetical protein